VDAREIEFFNVEFGSVLTFLEHNLYKTFTMYTTTHTKRGKQTKAMYDCIAMDSDGLYQVIAPECD
jgi:hypothetical protein